MSPAPEPSWNARVSIGSLQAAVDSFHRPAHRTSVEGAVEAGRRPAEWVESMSSRKKRAFGQKSAGNGRPPASSKS